MSNYEIHCGLLVVHCQCHSCYTSAVYGWLSPEFVAPESVEMTNQPRIGFSKGADFSGLPSNLQVVMDVRVIQNTASML